MRVVITISPAAPPPGFPCVAGAEYLGWTNVGRTDHSGALVVRKCGFAGSERCGAQHDRCLALSLAARRRLVCVCHHDNSRRNARAVVRASRYRPDGAVWQERNTAHHHGINLVAWTSIACALNLCASNSSTLAGLVPAGFSSPAAAHTGALLRFLAGNAPVLACPGMQVLAPELQSGN
ncbi:MAG: hypothetical protein NTX28_14090 [Novosphingobium sp.]|nr:hypothetical protein [Novosphingobium sp.]